VTVAEKFSENLLIQRRRARLSQEALGFAADPHRTEIGQLERGDRVPRIDTLLRLAGALNVAPVVLLAGEGVEAGKARQRALGRPLRCR
jgi:transcriptional regulator with XRE-family HTH domain